MMETEIFYIQSAYRMRLFKYNASFVCWFRPESNLNILLWKVARWFGLNF